MHRLLLLSAATCCPAALAAQDLSGIYVDRPEACAFGKEVDAEEGPYRIINEGGATILVPWGLEGVEVSCEWEKDIAFDWSEARRQIRPGYCIASEHVMPTVFVIESVPEVPNQFVLWEQGVETPTVFRACE